MRTEAEPVIPTALRTLLACLPDSRLAALVIELVRNSTAAGDDERAPAPSPAAQAPGAAAAPPAPAPPRPAQVHRGWPKGVPRKVKPAAAGDQKRLERLAKNAERRRALRATARAKRNGAGKSGNGKGDGELTPAAAVWKQAMALQPKTPWKIVSRELGTNEAQTLDAYRRGELPPGLVDTAAVTRFLELVRAG